MISKTFWSHKAISGKALELQDPWKRGSKYPERDTTNSERCKMFIFIDCYPRKKYLLTQFELFQNMTSRHKYKLFFKAAGSLPSHTVCSKLAFNNIIC